MYFFFCFFSFLFFDNMAKNGAGKHTGHVTIPFAIRFEKIKTYFMQKLFSKTKL